MKDLQSKLDKVKHNADEWVAIAKKFGEECLKIQKDETLNIDQKLEKQKKLGETLAKNIEQNSELSAQDKGKMIKSIHNYLHEWDAIHNLFLQGKK